MCAMHNVAIREDEAIRGNDEARAAAAPALRGFGTNIDHARRHTPHDGRNRLRIAVEQLIVAPGWRHGFVAERRMEFMQQKPSRT